MRVAWGCQSELAEDSTEDTTSLIRLFVMDDGTDGDQ